MASPKHHLLELLQIQGVKSETCAVLTTLARRSVDGQWLSAFVLHSVDTQLQKQDPCFSLSTLHGLWGPVDSPPAVHCANSRAVLLSAVAEALNHEGYRWMSDFLLIAIGKRGHQQPIYPSHPLDQTVVYASPCKNYDLDGLWDMLALRDGPRCCISGAIHNVTVAQLIPMSDDFERLARFRELAQVFFRAYIPSLTEEHLRSPQNAVMLSMYWKDRLDKGHLFFKDVESEFHAIPLYRDDADDLDWERQTNGLVGPSLAELYEGYSPKCYPGLDTQLTRLHRVLIETWQETGLAECLVDNIECINRMPKKMLSTQFLDAQSFGSLLKHKLTLL